MARAAAVLRPYLLPGTRLAIVLGSGFGALAQAVRVRHRVPYKRVPGFLPSAVPGHAGEVLFGALAGVPLLLLAGRAHYYEGYPLEAVTFPIRVLAELGLEEVLLTNAAGGIHPGLKPGDLMLLRDHLNFIGANPLRGESGDPPRQFVDLSAVYDADWRRRLQRAARRAGVRLRLGVYLAVSGPSYETPAEIRAYARLGADAVGMSTVPEAIVARACGLRVAGLSAITNLAAGRGRGPISHDEVLRRGRAISRNAVRLVRDFVKDEGGMANSKRGNKRH